MSDLERRVATLLTELASATPVGDAPVPRTPEARGAVPGGDPGAAEPLYPVTPMSPRGRRAGRWVAAAAAVVAVIALVGAVLVTSGPDDSPVSVSAAQLQVDTDTLGDGRMAVVIENDLYVADGPSGQVWKLTDVDRGDEVSHVSFSHDGEWVAFTVHDESGLWVSRWDGSEVHRIGRAPSTYSWSPTDDRLAYATQDEVRVAHTDGSSRALEGGPSPQPFTNVVWSPDGESLAFARVGYPDDPVGYLVTATLQGEDDPGWGKPSQYTIPVDEVLAWPTDATILVAGSATVGGASRTLQAALLASVDTEALLGLPQGSLVSTSPDGTKVAAVLPDRPSIERCDLRAVGSSAPCGPVWTTDEYDRTSPPSFSPDGASLAVVGTDTDGAVVLTAAPAPGVVGTEPTGALGEGLALTEPPAERSPFGTEIEPPQWVDEDHLLVRAGDRVVLVERTDGGGAVVTTVVEGERFLAPEDDYPGGSGLAYWSPT